MTDPGPANRTCMFPGVCGESACSAAGLCVSRMIACGAAERASLGDALMGAMSRPEVERLLRGLERQKGMDVTVVRQPETKPAERRGSAPRRVGLPRGTLSRTCAHGHLTNEITSQDGWAQEWGSVACRACDGHPVGLAYRSGGPR